MMVVMMIIIIINPQPSRSLLERRSRLDRRRSYQGLRSCFHFPHSCHR